MNLAEIRSVIPESVCECDECQRMCAARPCWPTPDEALALINAGFSSRLMLDFSQYGVGVLCPARMGLEGRSTCEFPLGQCVLQDRDSRCVLHGLGLKPVEARLVLHGRRGGPLWKTEGMVHKAVADEWNTQAGRRLVIVWKRAMRVLEKKKKEEQNENKARSGGS